MKKKAIEKNSVLLAIVALLFLGLWMYELFDTSDTKELCQNYAHGVSSAFELQEMLKEQNKDSSNPLANYWIGVSRFYAFSETLKSLVGYKDSFYEDCDSLYRHMIRVPDEVLSHTTEVIIAMDILSEDFSDSEGQKIISDLVRLFDGE